MFEAVFFIVFIIVMGKVVSVAEKVNEENVIKENDIVIDQLRTKVVKLAEQKTRKTINKWFG